MSNLENRSTTSIGAKIKAIRLYYRLNMKNFAKKLKVSHSYISEIEAEKKNPSKLFLQAVIATFGVNEQWLLYSKGEMFDSKIDVIAEESPIYGFPKDLQELISRLKVIYYEGTLDEKIKALGPMGIVYNEIKHRKDEEMIKKNDIRPIEKET